ncbi:TVP38/TMEM64 family protein [Solwaraspora sp. WMMB335]|uniref:TVP38/TMEM64 family protein n=1 Tax=Solwaraspora sp. WMMB335 TaxID=3404118 RepID=UPI003B95FC4B
MTPGSAPDPLDRGSRIRRLGRALRRPRTARFAVLVAGIGLGSLLVLLLPRPDPAAVGRLTDGLGPAAPVVAILAGAVLLVALVPRTFITLTWGALFGPVAGAGYSLAAAALAALIGFAVGRWLGREFVTGQLGAGRAPGGRVRERLARLDGWFSTHSVLGVMTVRLLPVSGFGMVSYGYGTTGARLAPFLVGSVLAAAPTAVGYAVLGSAVVTGGEVNWLAAAPAGLGALATLALLLRLLPRRSWTGRELLSRIVDR